MDILIEQEIALQQYEIRQNKQEVARLLHPSFKEVGNTGMSFNYASIVEMMELEQPSDGQIHSQDFECIQLEPSVQLLLYKSASVANDGSITNFSKRSSIWVLSGDNWQIKYHQGTLCSEF
jgi:hypothetical protein